MIHPFLAETFTTAPKSTADAVTLVSFAMSLPGMIKDAALYVMGHATGVALVHHIGRKKHATRKAHVVHHHPRAKRSVDHA